MCTKVIKFGISRDKLKNPIKYLNDYEKVIRKLRSVSIDADNLINIIENESTDIERKIAFLETTCEEILKGADYSQCKSLRDISRVYAESLVDRLFN